MSDQAVKNRVQPRQTVQTHLPFAIQLLRQTTRPLLSDPEVLVVLPFQLSQSVAQLYTLSSTRHHAKAGNHSDQNEIDLQSLHLTSIKNPSCNLGYGIDIRITNPTMGDELDGLCIQDHYPYPIFEHAIDELRG